MKKDLLKIINYHGVNHQQRKLAEEVFELQEAITEYEFMNYEIPATYLVDTKEPIAEEIADVAVMLKQFQYYYSIDNEFIITLMQGKVNRQLERIEHE